MYYYIMFVINTWKTCILIMYYNITEVYNTRSKTCIWALYFVLKQVIASKYTIIMYLKVVLNLKCVFNHKYVFG